MGALILAFIKAIGAFSLITFFVIGIACAVWKIVYYGCNCRKNPLGKTAMITCAIIWVVSASIINFA